MHTRMTGRGNAVAWGGGMVDLENPEVRWRARLHEQLDAILDARQQLETANDIPGYNALLGAYLSFADLSTKPIGQAASALMTKMSSLAAEAMGIPLRCAAFQIPANGPKGQRAALKSWLNNLEPILSLPQPTILGSAPDCYLTDFDVYIALSALDAGEVQSIFQPEKRGNRRANNYSLSTARLSALEWKRRLLALEYSEGDANNAITAAYGEQWDTVRKWEASCRATLGDAHVDVFLNRAKTEAKTRFRPTGIFGSGLSAVPDRLARAGDVYKHEKKKAAELSRAKKRQVVASEK